MGGTVSSGGETPGMMEDYRNIAQDVREKDGSAHESQHGGSSENVTVSLVTGMMPVLCYGICCV